MKLFLLTFGFLTLPGLAFGNVGFQTGNNFVATYLEGEVSVTCRNGFEQSYAAYRCSTNLLDPAEMAKVVGPKGLTADRVSLQATRADGSVVEKSERYDATTGHSKGRFNLWIHTLLQRPLLKMGLNSIEYRYTQGSQMVLKGKFQALVTEGPDRICRYRRHYYSNNMDDCRSGSLVCDQFFRDENYCER